MCGRYANTRTAADLSKIFAAMDDTDDVLAPDYNIAPTDPTPIVRMSESYEGRVLSAARWGLVPPWATDPRVGAKMINARAETVATMKSFAPSFARRRCLVPADGWYEWARTDHGKQPYFMTNAPAGGGLVFAGLWAAGRFGLTCSVLTMAAVGELAAVHDRMPLLLEQERWEEWLTGPADAGLLAPPSAAFLSTLELRPVGSAVGDVRNDGPELVSRVSAATSAATQTLF